MSCIDTRAAAYLIFDSALSAWMDAPDAETAAAWNKVRATARAAIGDGVPVADVSRALAAHGWDYEIVVSADE